MAYERPSSALQYLYIAAWGQLQKLDPVSIANLQHEAWIAGADKTACFRRFKRGPRQQLFIWWVLVHELPQEERFLVETLVTRMTRGANA